MQVSDAEIIGAVKIKDGLFIGDEYAAQDLEFVVTNKVTHIVNCCGKQIQNHWEPIGVIYLTLNWLETDYQVLFDAKDELLNEIYKFIDGSLMKGESILVHSVKGQNRSCCVLAAYFMKKYRWTLYKTLEFLHSRKPNLEIRSNFFTQLMNLENKLAKLGQGAKTYNWNEIGDDPKNIDSEELLLTNTFLNSKKLPPADLSNLSHYKDGKTRINWSDSMHPNMPHSKSHSVMASSDGFQLNKKDRNPSRNFVKSILKGSGKIFPLKIIDAQDPLKNISALTLNNGVAKQILNKSPSVASNLKDQSISMRPNSANGSMLKSNSTSVLDKNDGSNIQGNIIHITVNNFITNNNLTNNSATNISNKIKLDKDDKGLFSSQKLGGTSGSSSTKDLMSVLGSTKTPSSGIRVGETDREKSKRGYSPSMPLNQEKTKLSFQSDDYKRSQLDDDSPMLTNSNKNKYSSKDQSLNASLKQTPINSMNAYSSQSVNKQVGFFTDRKTGLKSLSQQFERETSIPSTNTMNGLSKYGQVDMNSSIGGKNNSSLYKYLTQGRAGPVRANVELIKPIKKNENEGDYSTSYMKNSLMINGSGSSSIKEKAIISRPATAPDNKLTTKKETMQDSPYYSSTLTVYGRTNKNIEVSNISQRQGSAQPAAKESANKVSDKDAKSRLRSSSPGNITTLNYFQELSNKPKWKY